MHPILFKLGSIPIHTYGFLIAVGFLVGIQVIKKLATASQLPVDPVVDLTFYLLLFGMLGARILFIFTRWDYFMNDPLAMFKLWEGGLVFYGGPIFDVPVAIWYFRKKKLPVWKTMDVMTPALAIAHAFGRFGCLGAGCCYGKPTGSDWGIKLHSDLVEASLHDIPLHPTQLYEATGLLILFFGLIWIFKKKLFDGQVALTYFMVYPILRSIVEVFRGDLVRGFVIDQVLSTSQFISLLVFLVASTVLIFRLKQVRATENSAVRTR